MSSFSLPHNYRGGDSNNIDDQMTRRSISSSAAAADHHDDDDDEVMIMEREHMFDKVVTPSDVGKLNRLVVPKQHAEKYFPLDDKSVAGAGLLLSFEDVRNGKPWRFRYSYWNSSQSYVITKGWSRFVKDKKLDAGDVVSFQRGVGRNKDRLFIDWRRRHQQLDAATAAAIPWSNPLFLPRPPPPLSTSFLSQSHDYQQHINNNYYPTIYCSNNPYSCSDGNRCRPPPPGRRGELVVNDQTVFRSVPVVRGKVAAKRLRLFGVTMDCPVSDSSSSDHDQFPAHVQYYANLSSAPPRPCLPENISPSLQLYN